MIMKKLIYGVLLLSFAAVSCSPLTFNMSVDMRTPSKSGLSLGNKNLSVIYLDKGESRDSIFISSVAEGFAQSLEKDYFSGEQAIGIYRVSQGKDADYASKDSLVNLLVETGSDVAFVFDLVDMGETSLTKEVRVAAPTSADSMYVAEASTPFTVKLYSYDAMNAKDTVVTFTGKSSARTSVYTSGSETEDALMAKAVDTMSEAGFATGVQSSNIFLSTWKQSRFTFYYYDADIWYKASQAAYDYDWKTAIDVWMSLMDTKDLRKRSCIEYNLAVTFYILGQKSIASQWLDRSDADYMLPESAFVRSRINSL